MDADGKIAARLAGKFAEFRPHADERTWRLYLGSEARALADAEGCGLAAAAGGGAGGAGVEGGRGGGGGPAGGGGVGGGGGLRGRTVRGGAGELAEGAEPMPGRSR